MTRPRDPTQFTRESAERIGRVVRAAELATPIATPLQFDRAEFSRPRVFRLATYTGAWAINTTKAVTFRNVTATPNTVIATNLTMHLPVVGTATAFSCGIARDATSWFLVTAVEHNVKRGTFTKPWNKNATAVVTLLTGGTITATNRHASLAGSGTANCSIARDEMTWEVVAAEC